MRSWQHDEDDTAWPELHPPQAAGGTSFKLALDRDAALRERIDPALWGLTSLTSLDLTGVGLRRLDDQAAGSEAAPQAPEELHGGEQEGGPVPGECQASSPAGAGPGLPGGLRSLARLRDLAVGDNSLGPALQPDGALHGLTALRSLDLHGNALETLPAALVSLVSLTSLNIGRNRLKELPWMSMSLLPELRLLAAPQNQMTCITGQGGSQAVSLPPRLTELSLRANHLTGDGGLAVLGSAGMLATLDVADNLLTVLPSELAIGCSKLSRLDIASNPWEDKKLVKLADAQQDQAPAKPILELLRKGQSRRQLKSELCRKPQPPPPRLYYKPAQPEAEVDVSAGMPAQAATGQKSGKKGRSKAAAAAESVTPGTAPSQVVRKYVTISREVLGVRPHFLATLLHVVVEDIRAEGQGEASAPFVFLAEGCGGTRDFESAFEANLGLLERGLDIESRADGAACAALRAVARLREFVAAQARVHAAGDLGDRRRKGALGSHNASALRWPLRFAAAPHAEVRFAPLALGCMEGKGLVSAADYAKQAASGRVDGVARDVALSLQRPAAALLALPLCPHLLDASGIG